MTPTPEEDLLRRLPSHDVDAKLAERLRREVHAVLIERAHRRRAPELPAWSSGYHRFVEPAVLLGLGLGYFMLSVQEMVALFQ